MSVAATRPALVDDRRRSAPRPRRSSGIAIRTPLVAVRAARGPALPQGRVAPADRRVQDPRRLCGRRVAAARRARPRRHHLLVGQPRPGRRPGGAAARRAGGRRHAVRCARASSARGSRPTAPRSSSSGPSSDERRQVAEALAAERGLAIIPPFDDDRIIAGQGTVGLEIVEDLPDVAAVLVPIGGGGLASGVAVAVRALRAERAADRRRARAGRRRAGVARARAGSSAGRPTRVADDRRRDADDRRSASGRSPTSRPCSTTSSR